MTAQQKAKKLTARREAADKLTSAERLRALAEESHGLARIVAKNPSTLISLLRDLSRSEDEATRKSVISNPRAPYDVLSNLELQFSELSVNNPALQFYNSLKPQFVGITLHIVGVCINRIGTVRLTDNLRSEAKPGSSRSMLRGAAELWGAEASFETRLRRSSGRGTGTECARRAPKRAAFGCQRIRFPR